MSWHALLSIFAIIAISEPSRASPSQTSPGQSSLALPVGTTLATFPGTLHLDDDAALFEQGPIPGTATIQRPSQMVCGGTALLAMGWPTQYLLDVDGMPSQSRVELRIRPEAVSVGRQTIPSDLRWLQCSGSQWVEPSSCNQTERGNWTTVSICGDGLFALVAASCSEDAADCVVCGPEGRKGCGCIHGEPSDPESDIFVGLVVVFLLLAVQAVDAVALLGRKSVSDIYWARLVQENLELAACVISFAQTLIVQLSWTSPVRSIQLAATCTAAGAVAVAAVAVFCGAVGIRRSWVSLVRLIATILFSTSTALEVTALVTFPVVESVIILYPVVVTVFGFLSFAKLPDWVGWVAVVMNCVVVPLNLLPVVLPSCPHQY